MDISQEKFDEILIKLVDQNPASYLLNIPGVYEAVTEDYNNMVLDYYETENAKPGSDYFDEGATYTTYGINVKNHFNRIEVHGDPELRNKIIKLLNKED